MEIGRTTRAGLAAALLQIGAASLAQAGTGQSISAFDFGPSVDSFAAFDPALGTLTSVRFDLFGQFQPLILSDVTPTQGYAEPLFITQSFAGFGGHGFSTVFAPTLSGTILTNTPGSPASVIAPFQDAFTFDAQSELIGYATDSYGAVLSAHLADFFTGGPSGGLIEEFPSYLAYAIGYDGSVLPSLSTFVQGGGTVTYAYTTAPGAAPEPATWTVMLAGLALAAAILRRRSAGSPRRHAQGLGPRPHWPPCHSGRRPV